MAYLNYVVFLSVGHKNIIKLMLVLSNTSLPNQTISILSVTQYYKKYKTYTCWQTVCIGDCVHCSTDIYTVVMLFSKEKSHELCTDCSYVMSCSAVSTNTVKICFTSVRQAMVFVAIKLTGLVSISFC